MWYNQTLGKTAFSEVRERICVHRELCKTCADAQEIMENDDITGDDRNYGNRGYYGKFLPNITVTGVTRVSR